MKVGDYLRYGGLGGVPEIGRLLSIDEDGWYKIGKDGGKCFNVIIEEADIIKSSSNLLDLIEKGDYVDGSKVIDNNYCYMIYDDDFDFGELKMKGSLLLENQEIIDCGFEIKSVLTKEQFEDMEYKLGGDNI